MKHFLINVNDGKSKSVASTGYCTYGSISPDSQYLVHFKYIEEDHYQLEAINLKTKKPTILDENARNAEVMWSADSKWVYYQKLAPKEEDGDGGGQLWAVNRDTGKKIQQSFKRSRYSNFHFDSNHNVVFYVNDSQVVICTSPFQSVKIPIPEEPDEIALYWGKE